MATAIIDIDGTLVDTNYHHAIAWYRAFRQHDIVLPLWQIHRRIGMGGDQVVKELTDEQTDRDLGDEIRAAEKALYMAFVDEIATMKGARGLIGELKSRGHTVVLASSAKEDEVERYLDLLDARELADAWTTAADVESTKPEPDLVKAALERADAGEGETALMIGDTPWDILAAKRAGLETLAVRTGGFGVDELREAGALAVYASVAELCDALDDTPLA
jgi:HAD superfamily hydrolase (TIGR01509 family)